MGEHIKLIRVGEPNLELLSKYCKLIKGYGTAAELADKVGVNASTISRILNGRLSSPITEDTIIKLGELIRPETGLTKAKLYRANGMADPDEMNLCDRIDSRRQNEEIMGNIVINAIAARGDSVWRYGQKQRLSAGNFYYAFPDLMIETTAIKDEDRPENRNWAFEFYQEPINPTGRDDDFIKARMARSLMEKMGAYITLSYQHEEEYESDYEYHNFPLKLSFVFSSLKMYEAAKDRFKDFKVPMPISLILVDIDEKRIVNEMPLRSSSGYRYKVYFDNNYTFIDNEDNEVMEHEWMDMLDQEIEKYMETKHKEDGQ